MKIKLFILLAVFCFQVADTASGQPLSIYTENNPPASYAKDGRPAGLAVEIVREILRRLKQPDTIEIVPWARGYKMAQSHENVALFSTTRLPHREKMFHWVGPIYTQTWGFYTLKDSKLKIGSLEDAKKVGGIGTYVDDAKEQFLKRNGFTNLVSANRNIINVRHLLEGNIDLWVSSDLNVSDIVMQADVNPSQVVLAYPFRKVENYIVFSIKTDKNQVDLWQEILDKMKQDGTYQRIIGQSDR
jgi:polar amino acid transport system substrate-binding protein